MQKNIKKLTHAAATHCVNMRITDVQTLNVCMIRTGVLRYAFDDIDGMKREEGCYRETLCVRKVDS